MVFKGIAALPPVQKFIQSGKGLGSMEDTLNPNGKGIRPEAVYQYMALAFISFFAMSIPSALLGTVVFLMAARFTSQDSYAFLLGLVYGLATIAFPYSNVLYQHQMAAFGAFVGFYLLWRVIYENASLRWLWAVGVLFSLTVITEYPVVPALAILFIWAAVKMQNRVALWRVVIAAIPLGLVFAAYNYLTFHTPIPAGYEYSTNWQDVHQIGFMSLTAPSLKTFLELTISTYRGLFFLSPALLLSIPGFVFMWRESKYKAETIVLALICAFFFLYNSSSAMWAGGDTVGPRYLTPMVPFMALPIAFAFNRWLKSRAGMLIIALLIVLSMFNVWVQTIGGQAFPPYYTEGGSAVRNPLIDYSLPLVLRGNIARNYGQIIGLRGFLSLIPLLVVGLGLYFLVPRFITRRSVSSGDIALKQAAGGTD
jgi:4-amino-4-deoxy-L-arabinose transferase-like glycosyltransferase